METIGKIVLIIACLYMAGLNLWLLFKDRLVERTESHQTKKKAACAEIPKTEINIIGKSKWNEEQKKPKQNTLEQEVKELKEQVKQMAENIVIYNMPLEKKTPTINPEEEVILQQGLDKTDVALASSQSVSIDELELMVQVFKGEQISKEEEQLVSQTIAKTYSTDLFEQMVTKVEGAKERAFGVLKNCSEEKQSIKPVGGFDVGRYV